MHYTGVVQKGRQRGAELGFPTANIPFENIDMSGVFAALVRLGGENTPRPTAVFIDPKHGLLEAHILDFDGDLYGKAIVVELCARLRDGREFADDAILRAAIAEDIRVVREYFDHAAT